MCFVCAFDFGESLFSIGGSSLIVPIRVAWWAVLEIMVLFRIGDRNLKSYLGGAMLSVVWIKCQKKVPVTKVSSKE